MQRLKGFNKYSVDKYGHIFSHYTNKYLKPRLGKGGYLYLSLSKDGKAYCKRVHRVIAEELVPNPKGLPQVNHIDGNKVNNTPANLEWCTSKYNVQHYYENTYKGHRKGKRVGESVGTSKLTKISVKAICRLLVENVRTQKDIASLFGVSRKCINDINRRKTWNHIKGE